MEDADCTSVSSSDEATRPQVPLNWKHVQKMPLYAQRRAEPRPRRAASGSFNGFSSIGEDDAEVADGLHLQLLLLYGERRQPRHTPWPVQNERGANAHEYGCDELQPQTTPAQQSPEWCRAPALRWQVGARKDATRETYVSMPTAMPTWVR